MGKGISVVEYAKREGISRQAAYDRINSGKIRKLPDGTIDPAVAARDWAQNKDELQVQRGSKSGKKKTESEPDTPHEASFAQLQRAEKALKIRRDQLRLKREEGRLLDTDEVRQAWAEMIATARAALLPIGGELADDLVGADSVKIREQIDRRVHKALSALAEYPLSDGQTKEAARQGHEAVGSTSGTDADRVG